MTIRLPATWARVRLGEVVQVLDAEREPVNASDRARRISGLSHDSLYPYYGATGQVGWIDGFRSEGESVLLGEDGAPFLEVSRDKAYLVKGRYWVNNHAHVLRGRPGVIDNRFLCYQLNALDYHQYVTGSTRLKLTAGAMRQIPLHLPPLSEQERIAGVLDELMSDLGAAMVELSSARSKLAQYRRSMLKAAVDGALTSGWRKRHKPGESGANLLERILEERRARWAASQMATFDREGRTPPTGWRSKYSEPVEPITTGLPSLPPGWTWASLDQLAWFVRNGLPNKPSGEPSGTAILRISAVRALSVDLSDVRYLPAKLDATDDYMLSDGDLLATRYNGSVDLLGVIGVVRGISRATAHPDKLIRIRLAGDGDLGSWLEICAATGASRAHTLSRVRTTAGQTGISGQDLKKMPVPLPPDEEQSVAVKAVSAALADGAALAAELAKAETRLGAQRQNILRSAFCGRLVPQDLSDEPPGGLLARILAQEASESTRKATARRLKYPARELPDQALAAK